MSAEKKILVLTSIFPADDLPKTFTPVVYYFVKEWIKMGYSVRVIHNLSIFPVFYYKEIQSYSYASHHHHEIS